MSDIRDQVVDDRGVIKKLQLIFPGYHGYRVSEDLRDADIYLKDELYKKMLDIINDLKAAESSLVSNGIFTNLDKIGQTRSKIQTAAADLKHHQAGYSGISAGIKVTPAKISSLYDLDMKIYEQIQTLSTVIQGFKQECAQGNFNQARLQDVNSAVGSISQLNQSRETLLYGGV